jgi:two-component system sensor kinase FixL
MEEATIISREVAALIAASPVPELLLSRDLTIVVVNDPYLQAIGGTRTDFLGRSIRDALAGSPALAELIASLEAAFRSDTPQHLERWPVSSASGDTPFAVTNAPVSAGAGEAVWLLHSLRPLSQLAAGQPGDPLALEIALQAAEARLRSIMQTVPDAMIIIDERGRIESLSTTAERLFGYSMSEVAGANIKMLMPSPNREQHDGYLERYLKTGQRHIIGVGRIVVGQRKDGSVFPMHLTIGELRSATGHYFTGFIRDLTDQQLTESRLRELQSEVTHMSRFTALGEMASTLAHEINQPLTAINNYLKGCHRLLEHFEGDQATVLRGAIAKASDQALRAGDIIRRLREFVARGDSDRRIESLPRLIEDASTLALMGAKESGVSVSFRLDPAADQVLADRIQIQQVLVNLMRNAIEVMAETPGRRALEIESASGGDFVEIAVADTGGGLTPDVAARLFQPFVTTKQKGMGLGLSICRTIVEAHGGKIWVEVNPGGGTIFKFTLRNTGDEETEIAG